MPIRRNAVQGPFDEWSVAHFATGAVMGQLRLTPAEVLLLSIGFEIFENVFAQTEVAKEIFGETAGAESGINMVADLGVNFLGYLFGYYLAPERDLW